MERREEEGRREERGRREGGGREERGWEEEEEEEEEEGRGWRNEEVGWREAGGGREEGEWRKMEDGWMAGLVVLGRRIMSITESKVIMEDKEFLKMMEIDNIDEAQWKMERNVKE